MTVRTRTSLVLAGLAIVASLGLAAYLGAGSTRSVLGARAGDAQALRAAYERWKAAYTRDGGERKLVLALRYDRGLSARFADAQGRITLDLADGTVDTQVVGLPRDEAFDVWLVDNRPGPGRTVRPEPGDGFLRLGRLHRGANVATLRTRLDPTTLAGFELDLAIVAAAGQDPGGAGVLFAAPSLFHRLYYRELRRPAPVIAAVDPAPRPATFAPFSALVPAPAWASEQDDFAALVARGAQLFFTETFDGNGRTCGSCHPAENNFTIDPRFIATLPPTDPLFVAEFNPNLARDFENPILMRAFGLILENVDGTDDLANKFTMRGVPHTLAMATSLTPPGFLFDGTTRPPFERPGWSGDGAPGGGTLRDFAVGAVTQHFTRTLNRIPGLDFRLPTDEELDAMEAFQRALGRQTDVDLETLVFKGPVIEHGKQLFLTTAKCNLCHANAGANLPGGGNANFNTGVEDLPGHPADFTRQARPRDGGFGVAYDATKGHFGNGTFNTPSLVEAADTPPFFHNNAVATLEEAVAFYTTATFARSPSGRVTGPIVLAPAEVNAVAVFLRVLNALENIRSASESLTGALAVDYATARARLQFGIAETDDAIEVLQGRGLHPSAVLRLKLARALAAIASGLPLAIMRDPFVQQALAQQQAARADLVR